MKTTLLSALRGEAKAWWYHADLRRQGNLKEAMRLERRSIKSNLEHIRNAKLAVIGHGGTTVYFTNNSRLTAGWEIPLVAHVACPVVDLRTIPDTQLIRFAVSGPMVNVDLSEDEGTGAFDYVTTKTYIDQAQSLGASVRNV